MTKKEFEEIFQKLNISYNEGIQNIDKNDVYPRVVFFDYVWEPLNASGKNYNTKVTYQVSFFSYKPRDVDLLNIKKELSSKNINPTIYHEYLKETREFHSYFSVEVLENIWWIIWWIN